jgi:LAO/AO transport system kinase
VETCSSLQSSGVIDVWKMVQEFVSKTRSSGFFEANRKGQSKYWMFESIQEKLKSNFFQNPLIMSKMPELKEKVKNDQLSSFEAARMLLDLYFDDLKK